MRALEEKVQEMEAGLDTLKVLEADLRKDLADCRQQMIVMSLQTVADLCYQALAKAYPDLSAEEQTQLRLAQQQLTLTPSDSSRMAAYDTVRAMHPGAGECPRCEPGRRSLERASASSRSSRHRGAAVSRLHFGSSKTWSSSPSRFARARRHTRRYLRCSSKPPGPRQERASTWSHRRS